MYETKANPKRTYFIVGSSLNWWNGGGELNVHSSVVADSPQGLSSHLIFNIKDLIILTIKIRKPNVATTDPIEEI